MIYSLKRFSEDDSSGNKSLETAGKIGLGVGAAAGLMSEAHYLAQDWNVRKLREGNPSAISQSEAMGVINKDSRNLSFHDIEKERVSGQNRLRKSIAESKEFVPAHEAHSMSTRINREANALKHSKLKRGAGRIALVAGGLGGLAYGISKMNKKKD